jgi:hypothetical protein
MRLVLRDNYEAEDLNEYVLPLDSLRDKAYHPYIAGHEWEGVTLQVSDNTPRGILKQMLPIANITVLIDNWSTLTVHQVQILCEVFPDSAGILKTTYVKDKNAMRELVEKINRKG